MKPIMITIACDECGEQHVLPLDSSGHYEGPLPCDSGIHTTLQVDPQVWRKAVEEYHARTIQ